MNKQNEFVNKVLVHDCMYLVHFTTQAQEKNNVGDYAGAKDYGNIALECNICTIVFHVVLIFILAITVPVAVILTRE